MGFDNLDDQKEDQDNTPDTAEDQDTDTSTDTSDDTDDSQEDTDSGNEEIFFNPKDVPKELQSTFRRMQKSFTDRKMQDSAARQKARMFDQLVNHPKFQKWVEDQRKANQSTSSRESVDDDDEDSKDSVAAAIRKAVKEELEPVVRMTREQRLEALQRRDRIIRKKFKSDHPDWSLHWDKMEELMADNPKLTYRQAYKIAAFGRADRKTREDSIRSKKNGNISRPNRTGAREAGDKLEPPKTVKEAANRAIASLRKANLWPKKGE